MTLAALLLAVPGCVVRASGSRSTLGPNPLSPSLLAQGRDVPPRPSPGCARAAGIAEGHNGLESGGHRRTFLLRLPPVPARHQPMPLVIAFHGWIAGPESHEAFTYLTEEGRQRGFAVAYPTGYGLSWNAGSCCGRAVDEGVDDTAFVRAMIHRLEATLCIDQNRIYATGMSNGALMAMRLACELSDEVAAVAPVSGADDAPSCTPQRPVSVLAFHGTDDFVIPYPGGWLGGFRAARDSVARWAARDGCAGAPTQSVWVNGEARCAAAPACAGHSDVMLCTILHGGHTWPGGGYFPPFGHTTADLDATRSMLEFFLAHPMRSSRR